MKTPVIELNIYESSEEEMESNETEIAKKDKQIRKKREKKGIHILHTIPKQPVAPK